MRKGWMLFSFWLYSVGGFAQGQGLVNSENDSVEIKQIKSRLDILEKEMIDIKIKAKLEDLPLKQPNMTSQELLKWTTNSLLEIYSYNFLNYQIVLENIREHFTDLGYESYIKALQDSKNLEAVKDKKLAVFAIPTAKAAIIKEGPVNAVYTWEIELPLLVSYQSNQTEMQQRILVTIEVVREPYSQAEKGVAIHAITAKMMSEALEKNQQPETKAPSVVKPVMPLKEPTQSSPQSSPQNSPQNSPQKKIGDTMRHTPPVKPTERL